MQPSITRRASVALEPYHACVYFVPEAQEAYAGLGLKGGWMGYFASRSSAMGAVAPGVVTATFFGFAPAMVERAIPDAWGIAAPETVAGARYQAMDQALRRVLGDLAHGPAVAEAAGLAVESLDGVDPAGRPLGAAWLARPVPDEPHLALWHALTVLREHRGDGHVSVLVAEGLHPVEAHITLTRTGRTTDEIVRARRGWSQGEWDAGEARLRDRGLLDGEGALTDGGLALRDAIELRTDALALGPWAHLGEERTQRLIDLATPLVDAIVAESFPYPNPMGLAPR